MRADRLLEIILLLQAQGQTTAGKLAKALGVSERTIYRDLDALSAAGIPVYAQSGPGGGCGLPDHYRTILTGVSPSDVGAVLMASATGPLADLGMDKTLQLALQKLVAALPAAQRARASATRQRLYLDSASWFRRAEDVPFLPILQEAIEKEQYVRLNYRRADDQERERLFAPYGLVSKASVWYVVGQVEGHFRVYRVGRILKASLVDKTFSRPADFDLPTYWAEWCASYEASLPRYVVTLEIAPELVEKLQSHFASPVVAFTTLESEPGGWPLYSVTFETIESACNWVLGCGAGAKVIAPAELQERITTQATGIVALYS